MLDKGSQRFTLMPGPDDESDTPIQTDPTAHAAPIPAVQADLARRLAHGSSPVVCTRIARTSVASLNSCLGSKQNNMPE